MAKRRDERGRRRRDRDVQLGGETLLESGERLQCCWRLARVD
jgi:hypothetical protein